MTLTLYLIRRFLFALLVTAGSILLLTYLIELESQLSTLTGYGASNREAARLTAMITPSRLHRLIPAIFGLAALWMSTHTSAANEITVIRAAGTSGGAALAYPAIAAFCVGLALLAVITPATADLAKAYDRRVKELQGKESDVFLESGGYIWFRQVLDGRQTILRAARTDRGISYENLHVFMFDDNGTPTSHIFAETAELVGNLNDAAPAKLLRDGEEAGAIPGMCVYNFRAWDLQRTDQDTAAQQQATPFGCFKTKLTAEQIIESFDPPALVPLWKLPSQIKQLEFSGFSTVRHRMHLHMELAKPLLLAATVLIGGGFTLRQNRGINTAAAVLVAVLCILAIIFIQEFARIMGEGETIPYMVAAWAPPATAMLSAVGLVSYLEGR